MKMTLLEKSLTINKVLQARQTMLENDVQEPYRLDMCPGQLYSLITDIQGHDLCNQVFAHEELQNCKRALVMKNWEIAVAAMPKRLYGIHLNLVVPDATA